MILYNRSSDRILAKRVRVARHSVSRLLCFLTRDEIESDEGMWFENCRGVHTIGMRATIDLIFLDQFGRVLWSEAEVQPGRAIISDYRATSVLEMGGGFLAQSDVVAGDVLELETVPDVACARAG